MAFRGIPQTVLDSRYVNVTGDTMTGDLLIQPITNSITAFQVSQADTTNVLTVDTVSGKVMVVGGLLELKDSNTYIGQDASNNMTFTDVVAGTRTLKQLGCPTYKYIKATAQSEGDLHLSGANWGVSKALIKTIRVITASTDWDLYILQNDNGYAADDANIPKMQMMEAGNGNAEIYLDLPYEDEDEQNYVNLYVIDNVGSATFDIYILGYELL